MFKIANAINLFFAGNKITSLLGAPEGSSMPDVKNRSLFQMLDGSFWMSLFIAIGNAFSKLLYVIVRWILNIVDFLQFFIKHLLGVDYWEKGNVKLETLGDSDIIFKFLYNETVQRVFRYMLGLFVVLLILFAIIAIIKSQYAVASEADKANNDVMTIVKRCMKAIFLVIIVPVMLVMGLLASNAVLAGLINTFNVNNRLTLGGQVFSASAYDANRYRKYVENGVRYSVSNHVNVVLGSDTKKINTLVTPVIPRKYGSDNKFTGFAFTYKGKNYLYYVDGGDITKSYGSHTNYDFYVEYFQNILGALLIESGSGWGERNDTYPYLIKAALNEYAEGSSINQAAYNTWYYNGVSFEASASFDKTVTAVLAGDYNPSWAGGWVSDSGNKYSDAKVYQNNEVWGALHDGGKNGLVVIKDEYLVMADVIDYAISDATEIAYVNAKSSKIDWEYGDATEGGYLSSRYVNTTQSGSSIRLNSFVVNYKDSGYAVYDLPKDSDLTAETDGVIYIVAYYSSARGKYIPLVNGKTFVDDYGEEHKFKSDNLDDNYRGLIVARGILETSFRNQYGNPTEINLDWSSALSDQSVTTNTSFYYSASANRSSAKAVEQGTTADVTFNDSNTVIIDNKRYTKSEYVETINSTTDLRNSGILSAINESLPTQFTYRTKRVTATVGGEKQYGSFNYTLENISWNKIDSIGSIEGRSVIAFKADKTIKARVPNNAVTDINGGTEILDADSDGIYELPLYAFVSYAGAGASKGNVVVEFVVSYCQNPSSGIFASDSSSLEVQATGKIQTSVDVGETTKDVFVGEYLYLGSAVGDSSNIIIQFSTISENETILFNNSRTSLTSTTGSILTNAIAREIKTGQPSLQFDVLQLHKDYSKDVINYPDSIELDVDADEKSDNVYEYHYYRTADTSGTVVRVGYNSETHELKLLKYSTYKFNVDNVNLTIGKSDVEYMSTLREMRYVSSRTEGGKNIYSYYQQINSVNYYFQFEYSCYNGVETFTPVEADLINIVLKYHNMFVYGIKQGGTVKYYQHSPVTGESSETLKEIVYKSAYVRPESIYSKYLSTNDGKYVWSTEITLEDNDKTPFATFYSLQDHDSSSSINNVYAINDSYRVISGTEDLKAVQVYDGGTPEDISNQHLKTTATVIFNREYVSSNKFYFDIQIFSAMFSKKTFRIKFARGDGFSENRSRTSAFQILEASLRLDYNFTSKNAPSLEMQIFYVPLEINFLILVFAACLLLSILGKSVWGLIQRIFDITLYFIILPGVASLMPFDDGSRFSTWKDGVISKTLSAYGVMIGLNLFFILCPAIKSISHLFTQADLNSLSEGNFLRAVTPGFINSVSELLFMLVALTMIQSAPGLIQSFVDTSKSSTDIATMGKKTKENVKGMTQEVGATISGSKVLDFVAGEKGKDGKRPGFIGQLKNFVPGSAIYDEVKKKFKKKDKGDGRSDAQRAAEERRRADADASLAQADDLANSANNTTEPTVNVDQTIPQGVIDQTANQDANPNAETQTTPVGAENSTEVGLTDSAEEGIAENVAEDVGDKISEMTSESTEADSRSEASSETSSEGEDSGKDHVAYADVAGRVQSQDSNNVDVDFEGSEPADENAEAVSDTETGDAEQTSESAQDGSSVNAERARMYAESARLSADASRGYADIAGGRVSEDYGITKDTRTKDQKTLDKLIAERDKRLQDQEEGKADVGLAPASRGKAYKQYNEDKAVEDSIYDSNKDAIKEEAIKLWNSKKGNQHIDANATDSDNQALVQKAVQEWKDEQAVKLFNAKNKTTHTSATELSKTELESARQMLDEDQKVKKAVARSQYKDKVLDDKIAKQQEKMALKEAGLYEGPLKKALLAAPRAIFSHKMTEGEEDKIRAKMDKWEKVGTETTAKLANMEKTFETELKEFTEKNKLVYKNGKIDRVATAKNFMAETDKSDDEAVKNEVARRAKEFDKLDTQYAQFADKDSYIESRREELNGELATARRRFDVYSAQLQGGRSGLAHMFAREARSGARAVKSSWQNARLNAAVDAEAKRESDIEKENRQKMNIDWSVLKDNGLDVDHKDHIYTEKQRTKLQAKYNSIIAAESKLKIERIALSQKGYKFDSEGNLDKRSIARTFLPNIDKNDPEAISKELQFRSKEIDKIVAQYRGVQSAVTEAKSSFASTVHKYDIANRQNFLTRGEKLQKAVLGRAQAEKKRLVSELDNATRSGRLEESEEASYLEKIKGVDETIEDISKHPVRYKPPKRIKFKNRVLVSTTRTVTPTIIDGKPVAKAPSVKDKARQVLSGQTSERRATINERDTEAAQKTAEKIGREEARKTVLDEATQRAYISQVRKALVQSGYAGDVSKIRTTEDAKRVAKEVESKLMSAAKENSEAFARKAIAGTVRTSEIAEFKAQEKLLNQRLKKIRSVNTNVAMNSSLDIRKDIKAASERAAGTAIRNQYKDEWNNLMKKQGLRDVAKSGSTAYEKNLRMQKQLMDDNASLEKRLRALETNGVKKDDNRIKTLQSKIDEQEKLISSLKSMNSKTEEQAKKALKNFTSMNKIMQDMRRQSKYKIPGLKNQGNGNDAKN